MIVPGFFTFLRNMEPANYGQSRASARLSPEPIIRISGWKIKPGIRVGLSP
jgi:hypothetical protein